MPRFKIPFTNVETYINYVWDKDIFDFKLSTEAMDKNIDLFNTQVNGLSEKLIGQHVDNLFKNVTDFYKHVSPQYREEEKIVKELDKRTNNVRDIAGLGDLIRFAGENETKLLTGQASYQLGRATGKYLTNQIPWQKLIHKIQKKIRLRIDLQEKIIKDHDIQIKQHSIQIAKHENRLNQYDRIISVHPKLLASHENRLNRHEKILNIHSKLLSVHEQRLNRHEFILNNHEKRLNQHESILNIHSSILNNHEIRLNQHAQVINDLYSIAKEHNEILKFHGEIINKLDERIFYAENNII